MTLWRRLTFQSRTPISIKIAAAAFVMLQLSIGRTIAPSAAAARALLAKPTALGLIAVWVVFGVWVVVAMLRLSRWPLLALPLLMVSYEIWSSRAGTSDVLMSASNLVTEFATWPVVAVLVAPHWRRLNWRLLGRLPTPADVAEHFS